MIFRYMFTEAGTRYTVRDVEYREPQITEYLNAKMEWAEWGDLELWGATYVRVDP